MEHLSIEEIIKYVTADKVDNETLNLLSKVNGHIRNCQLCREKVESYECINDEFKKGNFENSFDLNQINDLIKRRKNINKNYY